MVREARQASGLCCSDAAKPGRAAGASLIVCAHHGPRPLPTTVVQSRLERVSSHAFNEPVVSIHLTAGDVVRARFIRSHRTCQQERWLPGPPCPVQAWLERQPTDQAFLLEETSTHHGDNPGLRQVAETMTDAHLAAGDLWAPT